MARQEQGIFGITVSQAGAEAHPHDAACTGLGAAGETSRPPAPPAADPVFLWHFHADGSITRGSPVPPFRPSAPCLDCGWLTCRHDDPGEWYMVTDQVWEQAGMTDTRQWLSEHPETPIGPTGGPGHYLCIGCLETRLGRRLAPGDFPGLPINRIDWHRKTARLADRLGGGEVRRLPC